MEQLQLFEQPAPGRITQYDLENKGCDEIIYEETREAIASNLPLAKVRELIVELLTKYSHLSFTQPEIIAQIPQAKIFKIIRALSWLQEDKIIVREKAEYRLALLPNAIAPEPEPDVIIPKALQEKDLKELPQSPDNENARGNTDSTPSTIEDDSNLIPPQYHLAKQALITARDNLEQIAAKLPNQGITILSKLMVMNNLLEGYETYMKRHDYSQDIKPFPDGNDSNLAKDELSEPNETQKILASNSLIINSEKESQKLNPKGSVKETSPYSKAKKTNKSKNNSSRNRVKTGIHYTRAGIHVRQVKRRGKTYEQSYYHYEVRFDGSKPQKKTLYIPKRLESDVIRSEGENLPVFDIIHMIKSKRRKF